MVAESIGGRDTFWTIGSVLSTAASVWGRYLVPFVGTTLLASAPGLLFSLLVGSTATALLTTAGIVRMLVGLVVTILVIIALTYATVQALRGGKVSIVECLRQGIKRLPTAIGVGILAYIGIVVGSTLLIVPGLILLTMWAVSLPVVTVERTGVFAALSRSSELTRGHRWRVLGTILVPIVVLAAIGWALVTIFGLQGITSPLFFVVNWLVGSFAQAFNVCVFATLYYFLRREKEGVGIDQIASVFD
jgi:hypothetical protein